MGRQINPHVYTPEELAEIEKIMTELLTHVHQHDPGPLPMCIRYCSIIKKNIEICRAEGWSDRDVVSECIHDDWRCAMALHAGLPDYYIADSDHNLERCLNEAIYRYIIMLNSLIEKTE